MRGMALLQKLKRIISYVQLYANKFDNLEEMYKFLKGIDQNLLKKEEITWKDTPLSIFKNWICNLKPSNKKSSSYRWLC